MNRLYATNVLNANAMCVQFLLDNTAMNKSSNIVTNLALPPINGPHHEFAIRLRQALQYSGLYGYDTKKDKAFGSYATAAEKLPYNRVMVGELYRGEKLPDHTKFKVIAKACRVNYIWLRDGLGDMVSGTDYNNLIGSAPKDIQRAIDAILEPYAE